MFHLQGAAHVVELLDWYILKSHETDQDWAEDEMYSVKSVLDVELIEEARVEDQAYNIGRVSRRSLFVYTDFGQCFIVSSTIWILVGVC